MSANATIDPVLTTETAQRSVLMVEAAARVPW